jgi:hypothetical protein
MTSLIASSRFEVLSQSRQALFISHASPEDNAFTFWLRVKLTALGYEVFADLLHLKGAAIIGNESLNRDTRQGGQVLGCGHAARHSKVMVGVQGCAGFAPSVSG